MNADGYITIDTRVDSSGMDKGTKKMSSSLDGVMKSVKGIGAALIAAFSGAAIIGLITSITSKFNLWASSFGGSIFQLNWAFETLQGAVMNLIATALVPLIPYVVTVINWFTGLVQIITQLVGALWGMSKTVGDISKKTGSLAGFDKINTLNQFGPAASPPPMDISPEMLAKVEEFKKKFLEFIQPVTDAVDRLVVALTPLGETIWQGLKWAWDTILVPMGNWVMTEAAPHFLDLLGQAGTTLNDALLAMKPQGQWLWDHFLQPMATWTGGQIISIIDGLTAKLKELDIWIRDNPEKFQSLADKILIVAGAVWLLTNSMGFLTAVMGIFEIISVITGIALLPLLFVLVEIGLIILGLIWIFQNFGTAFEIWKGLWVQEFEIIKKVAALFVGWIMSSVVWPIQDAWTNSLTTIKTTFENIFNGIKGFVKGIINDIIGPINGMINAIVGGINNVIGGFNIVGSVMPGFSPIPFMTAPQIPYLATGAVIPPNAAFAAILGDQKSGTNIEAPEPLIRQIMSEELSKQGGQNITINFTGSGAEIARMLKPHIDRENVRMGNNLISGTGQVAF